MDKTIGDADYDDNAYDPHQDSDDEVPLHVKRVKRVNRVKRIKS